VFIDTPVSGHQREAWLTDHGHMHGVGWMPHPGWAADGGKIAGVNDDHGAPQRARSCCAAHMADDRRTL
jgi:hypothetical protein